MSRTLPSDRAVSLRPVTDADGPFLLDLYASTRAAELAAVSWDDATLRAFLVTQLAAQDQAWRAASPDAAYDVVVVNGVEAGRLYVDRRPAEVRLVDISLLPAYVAQGIGGRLLADLVQEAHGRHVPVTLHVERHNRARHLYQRLGFAEEADDGVYVRMSTQPRLTVAT